VLNKTFVDIVEGNGDDGDDEDDVYVLATAVAADIEE
jgi:hypothetical protein